MVKRIVYLSTYPFEERGAFSGTNRRIFDALKRMPEYELFYYQARPNPLVSFFVRSVNFLSRMFLHKDFQSGLGERLYASICNKTMRFLKRYPYDLIICWQLCFDGVFNKFAGKKVFFADSTYHKIVPYYGWKVSKKQFERNDRAMRYLLNNADQFWCFSSYFVDDAVGHYGIYSGKIHMFHFFPTIVGERHQESKEGSHVNLLLIGTNYVDKGVPIALQTVKLLNERYGLKAHIDIVGVGPAGDEDCVYATFHGKVSQFEEPERFSSFYEKADIYFMPTHHECAGIVFVEAASFGIPSISYDTGGVPDYVKDGETGILLPEGSTSEDFAKAIADMIAVGDVGRMSKKARLFYENELSRSVFIQRAQNALDKLFRGQ